MTNPAATFTHGSLTHHVRVMAFTSALSLLAIFLTDILTLTYVALLHDEALIAAVGIAKTLAFFNSSLVAGITVAAGTMISRRVGQGSSASLPALATHMLLLAALVSATVSAIQWYYLDYFASLIGVDAPASALAGQFIAMTLVASVLMALTQACAQALRAHGYSVRALAVVLGSAACLAVVDPILIFGFDLKLLGAGISCLVASLLGCLLGLHQVRAQLGLSARVRIRLLRLYGGRIARIALPFTLANLATPFALTYTMAQLALFGVSVMAGMAVMDRVLQITYCLYFALPSALVPILAQNLGAHRSARTRAALHSASRLVIGYGLLAWVVLAIAAPWLSHVFALSGPGQALIDDLCRFGPALWIMIGLDFIAISVFISRGQVWWVTFYAWLRASVGTLPFVALGAAHFAASGVMLGMWLGNALVALASVATAVWINRRGAYWAHEP
ncbi:putative 21 kDa protein in iaaL 5'region [Pseudomonas reidholzensis]|uniref:Putative 21 kDa protein in iaaL 5'region n=1 Tax=Pseudomonas reidholzensis TaxID=1785162 RepID=A0A383RXZ7_9PSED|nr:MATE family efflux transporter [Pseudomonas reidholzensis]SYX91765.1 putative 21 kDa protein in iaaL 5'region [Pseudomonas reidholzensis]